MCDKACSTFADILRQQASPYICVLLLLPSSHHHCPLLLPAAWHRSTIAELQVYKVSSLPWTSWELGSKAAQAHELAEWLYWLKVTWPITRQAAGLDPDGAAAYNPYMGPY
jgi:hypothetical protein